MCYDLYIASDKPLPLIPYDEENRAFHVDRVCPDFFNPWDRSQHLCDFPILKYFTKPYLYYFGSDTGCGCGFFYHIQKKLSRKKPENLEDMQSVQDMITYLETHLTDNESIEILVTGNSQVDDDKILRRSVDLRDLMKETHFDAAENDLLTVRVVKQAVNYPSSKD